MTHTTSPSSHPTIRPTASVAALMPVYVPRAGKLPTATTLRAPYARPLPTNFHGVRATVLAVLAGIGFMVAASMAHGAELPAAPSGVCTSKTTIRADGAIVTHKVCTYTSPAAK